MSELRGSLVRPDVKRLGLLARRPTFNGTRAIDAVFGTHSGEEEDTG